ncbi:hypothetical protein D3C75_186700 [compost metagenome]
MRLFTNTIFCDIIHIQGKIRARRDRLVETLQEMNSLYKTFERDLRKAGHNTNPIHFVEAMCNKQDVYEVPSKRLVIAFLKSKGVSKREILKTCNNI